ncbi:MAG TPA: hypothetical protein PL009_04880 [Flavipsychrobacter sp.]|nr:hypothetical protein [Flavipsychrobacter sp.]
MSKVSVFIFNFGYGISTSGSFSILETNNVCQLDFDVLKIRLVLLMFGRIADTTEEEDAINCSVSPFLISEVEYREPNLFTAHGIHCPSFTKYACSGFSEDCHLIKNLYFFSIFPSGRPGSVRLTEAWIKWAGVLETAAFLLCPHATSDRLITPPRIIDWKNNFIDWEKVKIRKSPVRREAE